MWVTLLEELSALHYQSHRYHNDNHLIISSTAPCVLIVRDEYRDSGHSEMKLPTYERPQL